jgi:hypothetical protein
MLDVIVIDESAACSPFGFRAVVNGFALLL